MARLGMVIDLKVCVGCHACTAACKATNGTPPDVFFARVYEREVGEFPNARREFLPVLCNHCEDPPCNQVCPVHAAFMSPEGITLVDPQTCIGCAYCVQACPYGTRFINPKTGTADKCTWCYHRIKRDEQPACVEACPVGARLFGRVDDPDSEISQRIKQIPTHVLKESMGTHPKTRYVGLSQEVI